VGQNSEKKNIMNENELEKNKNIFF